MLRLRNVAFVLAFLFSPSLRSAEPDSVGGGNKPVFPYTLQAPALPTTDVQLGTGIQPEGNAVTGSRCVTTDGAPDPKNVPLTAVGAMLRFKRTTDSTSQRDFLGINAGAQMGLGFFSGKVEARLAESTATSAYTTATTVVVEVWSDPFALKDERLTEEFERLARTDPRQFFKKCGRAYVHAIVRGGRLIASVSATSASSEQRRDIAGSLEANGVGWEMFAKFKSQAAEVSKKAQLATYLYQAGGDPQRVSLDELQTQAEKFASDVKTAGQNVAFSYDIRPYDQLPNWPPNASVANPAPVFLEQLSDLFDRVVREQADLDVVVQKPENFTSPTAEQATTRRTALSKVLKTVVSLYEGCATDLACDFTDIPDPGTHIDIRPMQTLCSRVDCGNGHCEVASGAAVCVCDPNWCGGQCKEQAFVCEERGCDSMGGNARLVCQAFSRLLGRLVPEPPEDNTWMRYLRSHTVQEFVEALALSREFQDACNWNIGECVDRLFERLLGRCAEHPNGWMDVLSSGPWDDMWGKVVFGVDRSEEYRAKWGDNRLPEPHLARCR